VRLKPKHCVSSEVIAASLALTTLMGSAKPAARKVKAKAPLRANSVTDSASLLLTAPSDKTAACEARNKAPLGANSEAILTSLKGKALHDKPKFVSKGRTKAAVSLCDATLSGEAILASPITKKPLRLSLRLLSPRELISNLLESL